jgi:hypothetical protein
LVVKYHGPNQKTGTSTTCIIKPNGFVLVTAVYSADIVIIFPKWQNSSHSLVTNVLVRHVTLSVQAAYNVK